MNFYTVSSYLSSFDNIDNTNFNNEQNHIEKGWQSGISCLKIMYTGNNEKEYSVM